MIKFGLPTIGTWTEHGYQADNRYEESVLLKHSTPGLQRNQLTRDAKREQLNAQGMSKFPADRDKLLDELYPKSQIYTVSVSGLPAGPGYVAPPEDARHIEQIKIVNVLGDNIAVNVAQRALRRDAAKSKGYEGDSCQDCGNFTLVRNGTCMKCNTCGATSGCS